LTKIEFTVSLILNRGEKMKKYVYHAVPANLKGTIIRPLNQLREVDNELYQIHREKYRGRELLLDVRLPYLDCLWNDVLHCTPIHPAVIKQALIDAGRTDSFMFRFYEIDIQTLDQSKMVLFHAGLNVSFEDIPNHVKLLDPEALDKFKTIPETVRQYYAELIATKVKRPKLHAGLPHVLYKGVLDTTKLSIIEV
jgi:hypothetical protein